VNNITESLFIDDSLINSHPRFPTLTENIKLRRKEKVNIQVPIFKDTNTKYVATNEEPYPGFIYMDAMGFGMGSTCLQTTFSAKDLSHARRLYDQMAVISPLFLALTAGSPVFKGKLANTDTRWDIISASVDCRNANERNASHKDYIPKSRYGSISQYISDEKRNLE
jgi:glutamate--cysteine ligase catalytic subunit